MAKCSKQRVCRRERLINPWVRKPAQKQLQNQQGGQVQNNHCSDMVFQFSQVQQSSAFHHQHGDGKVKGNPFMLLSFTVDQQYGKGGCLVPGKEEDQRAGGC